MKVNKSIKILVLIFIISFLISGTIYATNDVKITTDFSEDYNKWKSLSEDEKKKYIEPIQIPIQFNKSNLSSKSTEVMLKAENIPDKYLLSNDIELIVRNQRTTNSCWTFATTNMISTNLQKIGEKSYFEEFSTRHMNYATSKSDFIDGINSKGFNRKVANGGNYYMGMAYCTAGYGPILEEDMPFENNENSILLSQIEGKNVAAKVENYEIFPTLYKKIVDGELVYYNGGTGDSYVEYTYSEANIIRNEIKKHIINYGAVAALTYYDDTYLSENNSYYCNVDSIPNHAITIVGWDDNYSKTNFINQPQNDGAYIVLNSWGEYWGNSGYYYVSYDDFSIDKESFGVIETNEINYDNIYQYDELGTNVFLILDAEEFYAANVYKKNTSKLYNEYLNEFAISSLIETNAEIYVNLSGEDKTLSKMTKVATVNNLSPGYHTIKLDTPLKLEEDSFVICIKYSQGSVNTYIPLEYNTIENDGYTSFWDTATSNAGESYISGDGNSWSDLVSDLNYKDSNLCIKAFTTKEAKVVECGDINRDFVINTSDITYLGRYLNGINGYTLSEKIADVNEDGQIDWKDYQILKKHVAGTAGYETLPKPYSSGDISRDYKVNESDVTYLGKYLNEIEGYTAIEKIADVNEDGQVDWKDYQILKKHVAGTTGYEELPKPYSSGDINRDFIVNASDITYLGKYLNGAEGYLAIEKIADVNEDGIIDWKDYTVLKKHIAEEKEYETLPKSYSCGDINRDYVINNTDIEYLGKYLNGTKGYIVIEKTADVNEDGQVDWKDYQILKKHVTGTTGYETLPKPYSCGDINRDYLVNESDITYLGKCLNGTEGYLAIGKIADVNEDGQIDWKDYTVLKKYTTEEKGYDTLPKPYSCGDINRDYLVNESDITYLGKYLNGINGYTVIEKLADLNDDRVIDWKDYRILKDM